MTPVQTIETEGVTESFAAWIQKNSKLVGLGAVIVAVAAASWWFYLRSAEIKRLNAERGLNQAKQSLAAGNAALATTDLQRVASRYKGTPAGAQAAMLLAQVNYQEGKFAEGIQALDPYTSGGASGSTQASVWALVADGQTAQGKLDEAASSYRKAADASEMPGTKAFYMAKVARTLMAANKNAEAKAIWESLLDNPDATTVKAEANIRLGELNARPAGKT